MKIREYLDKYSLIIKDMSRVVGVTEMYLWSVSKGRVNPSPALAHRISLFSNGEIKVHEIRKCTCTCEPGCACSKGDKK